MYGRDPATNIPQVACSNVGAELILADADFACVDRSMGLIQIPFDAGLPMPIQLVRFACGGFSLTVSTNHLLTDGRAFILLLNSLAEMVAAIERRLYRIDAADLVELHRAA
jgi:hypothetical protein